MESAKNLHGLGDGIGSKKSGTKNAFAQAGDFAVFVESVEATGFEAGNL
jgi:hypothetical protein